MSNSVEEESRNNTEAQEALLYSARHGELNIVKEILKAKNEGKLEIEVSCKGKHKSNLGWTPLHLATYFGHTAVVEALLEEGSGVDINAVNDLGDTALHKAAFIGNEDLVVVLLKNGADVHVLNGEGKLAKDVSKTKDIYRLLAATEQAELRDREKRLLNAAKDGNLELVNKLLSDPQAPSINCVDAQGNTCLHCVAYRGHAHVAVILLQNGIDSTIRNASGHLAMDLAKDKQMREVLSVRPVRELQRTAARFEGALLKRTRFLGWRHVWAVLQRGVLVYYGSRAEAASSNNFNRIRRDKKYLDGAKLNTPNAEPGLIVVHFSDGDNHRLAIPPISDRNIDVAAVRQSWITAFSEHIAYSGHYLWVGVGKTNESNDEDDCKPLGSMQDALTNAANSLALFENQLKECTAIVNALEKTENVVSPLHQSAIMRFQHAGASGARALTALRHGCTLAAQAREAAAATAKREAERARVLEDALTALARQHHELEMSVAEELHSKRTKKKKKMSSSQNNIQDQLQEEYNQDSDSDTLVTAGLDSPLGALSPWGNSLENTPVGSPDITPTNSPRPRRLQMQSNFGASDLISSEETMYSAVVSPASSLGTLVSCGGNVYRNARDVAAYRSRTSLPVAQFSRGDFSLWSVLKNCVGKELSKITMPVVFNEPLSFLQRMLEYLEYAHLLRMAAEQEDPLARMEYVAGFAVSALASNWERLGKPFNPLLGETYELQRPEFRAICEQVSHHPPVSAFHADSHHFVFHGSVHPKLKFCGKSVEIQPKGQVTVELPRWGEAYTWNNVNCCVHNVIVGRLWIEQYGNMEVVCHGGAGLKANLTFKPAGWNSRDLHRVEGFIVDKSKKRLKFLYGKWTEYIKCCSIPAYESWARENNVAVGETESEHTPKKVLAKLNSFKVGAFRSMSIQEPDEAEADGEVPRSDPAFNIVIPDSTSIWEATPRPSNTGQYYQFTSFAMSLNELEPGMTGSNICPTDSRLRPDVRKLEAGDIDGAAAEKTRLEDKQRIARKGSKKSNQTWQPRWFSQGTNPYSKQEDWLYNGGYWDRNYEHLKDIDIF